MKQKKTILILDDDSIVHELLMPELRLRGYEVEGAMHWKEAIELLSRHSIDLLILDIMLPEIDGFTLMRLIKENFSYEVPIIVYSALDREACLKKGEALGCENHFTKPTEVSVLCDKADEILNGKIS